MSPEMTFGMLANVIFGGLDTVAASLSFVTRWLAENPEPRKELARNPTMIPDAEEELYRRFGIPQTARVIAQDFVYKDVPFRRGEQILLSKTLHGLDERRYPDPLKVDFARKRAPHAAFGDGPHRCPGSFLARQELKIFLEEWLARIPDFRIKPGTTPVTSSGMVNGVLSLQLAWDSH
jgi:cytochrome P450